MIKLRPIQDRVIVKQHDVLSATESGIVLAGNKDKPLKGTVLEVGPGRWLGEKLVETTVKPGDTVIFGKDVGEEIDLGDDNVVLVLFESQILATLDE